MAEAKVVDGNGNVGSRAEEKDVKIIVVGDRKCGKSTFIKAVTRRLGNESEVGDTAFDHAAVYSANYNTGEVTRSIKVFEILDNTEYIATKIKEEHGDYNGIVFMYAIDNPSSFEALVAKWIATLEANECKVDQPSVLVGNKKDLRDDRRVIRELARNGQAPVTTKQGEDLKRTRNLEEFFETMSTDNDDQGLISAFDSIVSKAILYWRGDGDNE